MKENRTSLFIPLYRQQFDFTCGPASLMMAMKYFQKKLDLTKDLELDIWREATMVEIYGTSRYGLAFSAAIRGFGAKIFANVKEAGFVKKIEPMIGKVDQDQLNFFLQERRDRCANLGVEEEKIEKITEKLLRDTIAAGSVPLLLSNTEFFSAEDIPHWIVITGIDRKYLYINNPDGKKARQRISLGSLYDVIGYKGDQCMVTISNKQTQNK